MSKPIRPIRHIVLVREKTSRVYTIYRTLADACNYYMFEHNYHTVWRFMKAKGHYEDDKYMVEKRPVFGKHSIRRKYSDKKIYSSQEISTYEMKSLRIIKKYIEEKGREPSFKELSALMGRKTTAPTRRLLEPLEKKGLVTINKNGFVLNQSKIFEVENEDTK